MMCNSVLCKVDLQFIVYIIRRIQERYYAKQMKLYMCLVDVEEAFDRVPSKLVAMRKKLIPDALIRVVMNLHKGVNIKEKVGTHLYEALQVNVGVHQGSALSQYCCFQM